MLYSRYIENKGNVWCMISARGEVRHSLHPGFGLSVTTSFCGISYMRIRDIQEIIEAQLLSGDDCLDHEVKDCFACDLISEMLLHLKPGSLLVTSLLNAHVVHTAHVMDASGVVFAGGKKPNETIIANAQQNGIPILSTSLLIYECCGRLFLRGVHQEDRNRVSGD